MYHFEVYSKYEHEVIIEDKNTIKQMLLIEQLEENDKPTILKLIDKMLSNKNRFLC